VNIIYNQRDHVFYRYDERRQRIRFTDFRHAKRRPIRM
jgi:hypothetical protein